jgi:hypothetical protein
MKNEGMIPGFIGEAMRSANIESITKEEDMGPDTNPLKINKLNMENQMSTTEQSEVSIDNSAAIALDMKMFTSETKSRIISGNNAETLEKNTNEFLKANPNITILDTKLATTNGGIYYSILYKSTVERV